MKMLQVINVASLVGGTAACAWSIRHALPDFGHTVVAWNRSDGEITGEFAERFACQCLCRSRLLPEDMDAIAPDIILYHNTSPDRMPDYVPEGCVQVYYQHSNHGGARAARNRCAVSFACSQWLADRAGIPDVLHQPVPCPPPGLQRGEVMTIGRICTPQKQKWPEKQVIGLYRRLFDDHPDVMWEFVGCPPDIAEKLQAMNERTEFHNASPGARSILWRWDAMLYSNRLLEESYGRTVCEAQRAGCVPIVDDLGGFVEQINHGATGFLCGGPDAFSRAVRLLKDNAIRAGVSEHAQAAGNERGSLSRWRNDFLAWLQAAVEVV